MPQVTKTFTVTGPDDTIAKLESFFAQLHYNGGHSGIFGISFDGDGHESAKFEPKPRKFPAGSEMGGVGADAEIATSKDVCTGYFFKDDKKYVARGKDKAVRQIYDDRDGWIDDPTKKEYASWVSSNCKFAQAAPAAPPAKRPPPPPAPWANPPRPQAQPARPMPQQQPTPPRPQQQYNAKADWGQIEPRLKRLGILPGSFEYAQYERLKNQGPDAVLKYVGNLEKQYFGHAMASFTQRVWVKSNCRFAAAPPDIIKQQDPQARAWMYLGGELHQGVGKSHIDLAREGIKSGAFGPQHMKDLTGDPPMGRAASDGTVMGLWFSSDQAMLPPFSTSMNKAIAAGMVRPDAILKFVDGKEMNLQQYQEAVRQAEMTQIGSEGVPVGQPQKV